MDTPRFGWFVALVAFSVWTQSCAPPPEESTAVAASVETGFDFIDDAFGFANFGGDAAAPQLDTALMRRMFGDEAVCAPGSDPCALTPAASAWMTSTNATLDAGRSEGFSTLALLFHSGALDPNDFGAERVADLRLVGNRALQDELAYWAAAQAVPSAQTSNRRFQAKDVMPFLQSALSPDAPGAWRLAIAQKTDLGFQRGHALVPFGFFLAEGGVYWLRVYDNNFPGNEQRLRIDPAANTWRYVVTDLLGEELVYEGTPENGNLLYFSDVSQRAGVLDAPFVEGSGAVTVVTQGMTAVVEVDGEQTGLVGGEVVEFGDDRVTPAFSACPLCGNPVNIVNQALIKNGVRNYDQMTIKATGDYSTEVDESTLDRRTKSISTSGDGYSTTISPSGVTEGDTATLGSDGQVSYTSTSSDSVTIETTVTTDDGATLTVKVTVTPPEGGDADGVTVNVSKDSSGSGSAVDVEGAGEGTKVTYEVVKTKDGESTRNEVTFDASGDTSVRTDGDLSTGVTGGASNVDPGTCDNGVFDPRTETSVDCGNLCGPCRQGVACRADADCFSGATCTDGACALAACSDGAKNGQETDVDCGGDQCLRCVASNGANAPACLEDADCDSRRCTDGFCRVPAPVKVVIPRLVASNALAFEIDYRLDGGEIKTLVIDDYTELTYPYTVTLGDAVTYAVDYAGVCRTDFGVTRSVLDSDTLTLDCPPEGSNYLVMRARNTIGPRADDPWVFRVNLDGVLSDFDFTGVTSSFIGTYTQSWRVRPRQASTLKVYTDARSDGAMEYLECRIDGFHSGYSSNPEINCYAFPFLGYCSDGVWNQDESSPDCGGVCPECENFKWCNGNDDCASGSCNGRQCFPATCDDGIQNQGEANVDCGGPNCSRCPNGTVCAQDDDCVDRYCNAQSVCATPTCSDGVQNQGETDVDCGGFNCAAKCADGQGCQFASDCVNGYCNGAVCVTPTCSDNVQNGGETATDCGGPDCAGCAAGSFCNAGSDCASGSCAARQCNDGSSCNFDTDCSVGLCRTVCSSASCSDSIQNQDETDVDCGGATCAGCGGGLACVGDSDCDSGSCVGNVCGAPTCSDGAQNQMESDVDCGGPNCAACADGGACGVNSDCASNSCSGGVCVAPTCSDSSKNQDETDVDCGGATCGGCADGLACVAPGDCGSGVCSGGVCGAASCSDGVQNQDETGVDCGGATCGSCPGDACTADTDCAANDCQCGASSGSCAGDSGTCGAGQYFIDQPVTDGTTASGTYTIPAGCTQLYVQAWGAGGGAEDQMGFPSNPGGGAGFVDGTIAVTPGDTVTVWLGEGGESGVLSGGSGSYLGAPADGGAGGFGMFGDEPGGGGGLTSIQITGTTPYAFSIPAGAGGVSFGGGDATVSTFTGGGGAGDAGEAGSSGAAGGGAGDPGGTENNAGAYGTLPGGLTAYDGDGFAVPPAPAGTNHTDYSRCQGVNGLPAGAGDDTLGVGGDACVVLRCVGP